MTRATGEYGKRISLVVALGICRIEQKTRGVGDPGGSHEEMDRHV
jgi:hypothetical protein